MTARSSLWLVSLPERAGRAIAERLSEASGLAAVVLESADEAIARLDSEVPALVVLDGNLGETERFALYCQVASAASGDDIPFVLVDAGETEARVRLEGSADRMVGDHTTASALTDAVWASVTLMTRAAPQAAPELLPTPAEAEGTMAAPSTPAALPAPTTTLTPLAAQPPTALGQVLAALGRRWWLALAVLAAVMVADAYYTATRQPTYLARATLIISPSANVERGSLVYSVDSLGRGRIVGTYAEVLGSELVHRGALERLGYPPSAYNRLVVFRSSTVADTAVVQVTAESPDPALSAEAANQAGEVGIERMTDLFPVYNLVFLSRATPPTSLYRPDIVRNYSLGLLVGLVLAIVVAYAVDAAAKKMRSMRPVKSSKRAKQPAVQALKPSSSDIARPAPSPRKSRFSFPGRKRAESPAPVLAATPPPAPIVESTDPLLVVAAAATALVVETPASFVAEVPEVLTITTSGTPAPAPTTAQQTTAPVEEHRVQAAPEPVNGTTEEHRMQAAPAQDGTAADEGHLGQAAPEPTNGTAAAVPRPAKRRWLLSAFARKPNRHTETTSDRPAAAPTKPSGAKQQRGGWSARFSGKPKESKPPAAAPSPPSAPQTVPSESTADRLERVLGAAQSHEFDEPVNPSEDSAKSDREARAVV